MTTLTITPNWKNKTARFKGTIAAGEHVAVRIVNDDGEGDEYIQAEDLANLRLRVVNPMNGKTLAQFPMPEVLPTVALEDEEETEETEGTEATEEDAETWGGLTPLTCELNLNTDRMLMAVPPGANVQLLFVLDAYEGATDEDEGEFTLYFKDLCEVTHWPRRRGEDEPTNLDDYKDLIEDFRERIDAAEDSIRDAVDEANGIVAHVDAAKTVAQNSATAAGNSASAAQTSAATAKDWATGGGATGDPGAENNAKYFAQQAGASATSAEGSATSAATAAANAEAWAVGKRNGVDVPSTDDTYENNAKHYAAAAAASAQEAEETLENKADKATTLAGYGIADAYTKTETDGKISTAVSAEATARNTAIANAINAVKDSAPAAFDTLKEIADWIADDQSGAAAMAAQISSHTSQLSQLSQNKVDKVAGKGLSTNDYTAAEKEKLSGVEAGAKDNVVEAAGASAFPQIGVAGKIYVAKDENKTYRWDGTQYVQIAAGGSSIDVVPPSTDPADAGKAADAKATGDALAGKRGLGDFSVRGAPDLDEWRDPLGNFLINGVAAVFDASATGWVVDDSLVTIDVEGGPSSYHYSKLVDGEPVYAKFTLSSSNHYEVSLLGDTIIGYVDALAKASDIPAASFETPQTDGTASAGSSAAFARADHVHPTDMSRAATNDVALTPVFTEWTILRAGVDVTAQVVQPRWSSEQVEWGVGSSIIGTDREADIAIGGTEDALNLTWEAFVGSSYDTIRYSATRSIIGYRLGNQSDKPLQPKGDYATTAQLAQKADASALRYDLGAEIAISSASQEVVEGETVTYGGATLADRAANRVAITAAIDELRLTFPAAVSGKVRDFGLRVEVGDGTAALTAPALVPPAGVTVENPDGAIPELADGTDTATGVTLLYFSETSPGVFLVKGEQVKEA